MTAFPLLDPALCFVILTTAVLAVAIRTVFAAVVSFIVFGLLMAIAWVRLGAVDVALTEAAIGAGLTGVLLLSTVARIAKHRADRGDDVPILEGPEPDPAPTDPLPGLATQSLAIVLSAAVAAALVAAVALLPVPAPGLVAEVGSRLSETGVESPVTAVLLAYRGYDTLLEIVVLLFALLGVWSLTADARWGGQPGLRHLARPDGVMAYLGRLLPPIGLLVGVYLFWIGGYRPGGAFQAGTVLAAVWLLAVMAGLVPIPKVSGIRLRLALVIGPAVFLAIGLAGYPLHGAFLGYPPAIAKVLIILIEAGLTISIATILGLLVAGAPEERPS